jgi:ammonium transporter, Amt family
LCLVTFAIIGLRLNWLVTRLEGQSRQLEENLMELTVAHLRRDQLEASLRHQTLHDPLTGLANRMLFEDRLSRARERATRQSGVNAVLMFDLDDFKQVNDAYGHFIGDQLLIEVARRLEGVTRSADTLCRFGGDEFLYLAEGLSDRAEAEAICRRILEAFSEPFVFGDIRLEQHASIGLVICDYEDEVDAEYVRDADAAMYEAKRFHKGHYVVFEPSMHNEALSVFSLTQELRTAFQQHQLTMHFQPIVDLHSLRSVGFEALMRWPSAQRGWVSPDVFIPLAEESDLITDLGAFALAEAASAATAWNVGSDHADTFVTVNLSPRQLHDANIVSQVQSVLAHYALAPERLILEITERTALVNIDETISIVERLAKLGVGLALDDFGTGHSSLSYVALLQPKIIKIDRSFVAPLHDGRESEALLETIVSLGRKLGITMLAEGIETPGQLDRLRRLGCELGQGFLFSEAVPSESVGSRMDFAMATANRPLAR